MTNNYTILLDINLPHDQKEKTLEVTAEDFTREPFSASEIELYDNQVSWGHIFYLCTENDRFGVTNRNGRNAMPKPEFRIGINTVASHVVVEPVGEHPINLDQVDTGSGEILTVEFEAVRFAVETNCEVIYLD